LTHTREKLGYVQVKNEELSKINSTKETELNNNRTQLNELKKEKERIRNNNLVLK